MMQWADGKLIKYNVLAKKNLCKVQMLEPQAKGYKAARPPKLASRKRDIGKERKGDISLLRKNYARGTPARYPKRFSKEQNCKNEKLCRQ